MTNRKSVIQGVSRIALAMALSGAASAAWAQDKPTGDSATVGEVIVTGSRIGRTSFTAPVPVNVVSDARMKQLAIPSVADALNQLPSFRATTTQSSNLFRISGTIGGNTVDLRGLGPTRTLVLVDGRRFVPSADNGTVDLNAIPSGLVKRTEIVTGGASAAYGADAVAGVVNLILDTSFNGFKFDASTGVSDRGDGKNYYLSAAVGHGFANDRGHFIIGAEYQKDKGVGTCEQRSWCDKHTNFVANPGYIGGVSTNGLPATLVLDDVNFVYNPNGILMSAVQTVNGVKTTLGQQLGNTGATALPAGLRGLQFNSTATALVPFQFGNYLSGAFMQGGDASARGNYGWGDVPLVTPTSHFSLMTHVDYDLTDKVQAFGEFMYSHVEGGPARSAYLTETPVGGAVGLDINNPFITPAVRAQILAVNPNITAINVNVVKPETGDQAVATSKNSVYRGVIGFKGEISNDWRWDASYEHGETHSRTVVLDTRLSTLDVASPNAITPPAGYAGTIYSTPAGAPVICASSVANPSDGCIPVNFLGANSITPAALAKYFQNEWQTRTIKQDDLSFNLRGTLFQGWAGPILAAAGAEYRADKASGQVDPLTAAKLFTVPQVTALPQISRKVTEGYLEANIPLLANLSFAKNLELDLTQRFTHYSTFGNAHPWKIGLVYEPNDQILFRLTKSSDIRAPTAAESNPNTITTNLPLVDPFGGGTHPISSITGGNPDLNLEHAKTKTIGVVLKPNFIPNFRVSVDWYDINVNGAIDSLSAPAVLSACATQNLLCNLITFSGAAKASPASVILSNFQNLSKLHAQGYELVASYTIHDVVGGDVDFQLNANYVDSLKTIGGTGVVTQLDDVTGNAGSLTNVAGVPKYKIDGVVSYSQPGWSVTAHGRYIPKSILDPTKVGPGQAGYNVNKANSVSINTVSARFYLDLSGSLQLPAKLGSNHMELYGAINNVLDAKQPPELRLFGNPLQYDVIGRAYRIGVRAAW